jgi:3-deoxy-D-manno-octulosonic-acid transferase
METELWPNWLAACEARHLPVTILNARLSERSRYGRFQGAFDALSRPLTHLLCQHQDDADRFHRLGIGRNRLAVTGSIKFDIQFGDEVQARGRALRQQLGRHDLSGSPPAPTRKTSRCWPPSIGCSRPIPPPC